MPPIRVSSNPHTCTWKDCGKFFGRKQDLKRHYAIHTGEASYFCDWDGCGKRYYAKDVLERHRVSHTGERPHPCPDCDLALSDPSALIRHRKRFHGYIAAPRRAKQARPNNSPEKSLAVAEVPSPASENTESEGHEPGPANRKDIGRSRSLTNQLAAEVNEVAGHELLLPSKTRPSMSPQPQADSNLHTSQYNSDKMHPIPVSSNPHACTWKDCGKVFRRKEDLKRHYAIHTGEASYFCDWDGCGRSYYAKDVLERHRVSHTGERPHPCPDCDSALSDPSALIRHRKRFHGYIAAQRREVDKVAGHELLPSKTRPPIPQPPADSNLHTSQYNSDKMHPISVSSNPHTCTWKDCGKVFGRKQDLKRHYASHTGEASSYCDWDGCGKRLCRKDALERHYRLAHTGQRPHTCPDCDSVFNHASSLLRHRKRSHGYIAAPRRKARQARPNNSPAESLAIADVPSPASDNTESEGHEPDPANRKVIGRSLAQTRSQLPATDDDIESRLASSTEDELAAVFALLKFPQSVVIMEPRPSNSLGPKTKGRLLPSMDR
ncbi:zinc finger protein 70 [Coprinopsis cinerea AmutBmut pab1-1]|nr:zinc finger protein 70 [Coprinopsis cinerea AmutBmut pab1-1]